MNNDFYEKMLNFRTKEMTKNEKDVLKYITKQYSRSNTELKTVITDLYVKHSKDGKLNQSEIFKNNRNKKLKEEIQKVLEKVGKAEEQYIKYQLGVNIVEEYSYMFYVTDFIDPTDVKPITVKDIEAILLEQWYGEDFTQTIKTDKALLTNKIYKDLMLEMSNGAELPALLQKLEKSLQSGVKKTQQLYTTEQTRKNQNATNLALNKAGNPFSKMKWSATLSERTCDVCGGLDGKTFSLNNLPIYPAHPYCRCRLLPVIPELEGKGEEHRRIEGFEGLTTAKTYEDWKKGKGQKIGELVLPDRWKEFNPFEDSLSSKPLKMK